MPRTEKVLDPATGVLSVYEYSSESDSLNGKEKVHRTLVKRINTRTGEVLADSSSNINTSSTKSNRTKKSKSTPRRTVIPTWPYNLVEDLEAFFDAARGNDAGTTRVRVPLTEDQETGLQHALDMLTEEERTFILTNYREELSKTEIAAANGTSIGRVEMMVKRALMKMAHPAVFYQIQYGVRGCRVVQATREVEEREQWIAEKEQELQEREARLDTFDVVSEKLFGRISIYQMEHVDGAAVRSIAEEGVRTADQFMRKLARDPLWLLELRNISNETREQIFLAYGQMLHRIRDAIRENQIG